MTTERHSHATILALLAAAVLGSGCSTNRLNNSWPEKVDETYRAIVRTLPFEGAPRDAANDLARLTAYYQALQDEAGVSDLEAQYIGCLQCIRLTTGPTPGELTFIFFREHSANVTAFSAALARVQAMPIRNLGFTLTFDNVAPAAPFCSKPVPTCFPIPSCVVTSGCDADRAKAGCQPCPP